MTGIELIERITHDHPEVATLLLTTFDEDEFVFGALRSGAHGFLLKDASPETLAAAILTAARGGMVIDSQVAGRVVARLGDTAGPGEPPHEEVLTAREEEVARLVATGASNQEIASRLLLSEGTVKNHVSAALRKLGLRDRTQLALFYAGRA
jgi:DNA-binding NarL/FixJ family response regulator